MDGRGSSEIVWTLSTSSDDIPMVFTPNPELIREDGFPHYTWDDVCATKNCEHINKRCGAWEDIQQLDMRVAEYPSTWHFGDKLPEFPFRIYG